MYKEVLCCGKESGSDCGVCRRRSWLAVCSVLGPICKSVIKMTRLRLFQICANLDLEFSLCVDVGTSLSNMTLFMWRVVVRDSRVKSYM